MNLMNINLICILRSGDFIDFRRWRALLRQQFRQFSILNLINILKGFSKNKIFRRKAHLRLCRT